MNMNTTEAKSLNPTSPPETEQAGDEEVEQVLNATDLPTLPYLKSGNFVELLCCVVFLVLSVSVSAINTVRQRPIPFQLLDNLFYVENQVNSQEFTGETIPDWLLIVVGILLPFVLQLGLSKLKGIPGDLHATGCVYLIAMGLNSMTTEALKLYVGYLRPIFYALCEPSADYSECTSDTDSGRKSFPSGHASTAFCGLSLLTIYIHKRFGIPSQPTVILQSPDGHFTVKYKDGPPRRARLISVLSLVPLAFAAFIAASRVVDNKHFPADVIGGAILGTAFSIFVHSLWFPSWPIIGQIGVDC